jgi:D-alanine-D-alanine ligase-like ATP-grasp enzyme
MKVIVFFGGRTPEHDVSIASAMNVLNGLDKKRHTVEAVYIAADGSWSQPVTICEPLTEAEQMRRLCGRPMDMGAALRGLADHAGDGIAFPVPG